MALALGVGLVGAAGVPGTAAGVADSWVAVPPLEPCAPPSPSCTGREGHAAAVLASGEVLVAGGGGAPIAPASAQVFDPKKRSWRATAPPEAPLTYATASPLENGKVLVVGATAAQLYDPAAGTWARTAPMRASRGSHTATVLRDGRVLVVGGLGGSVGTATAEIYDAERDTWSATGSLARIRLQHAAVRLSDGRVLVAGGWSENYGPKLDTAEIYDPSTGAWTPTGRLGSAPIDATATLLDDGRVLLAGGQLDEQNSGNGGDRGAQLYDPQTATWQPTGAMGAGRSRHTATLLPDGKVLVVGGNAVVQQREGEPPSDVAAELFDPAAGAWTAAAPLALTRSGHTATLLPDTPASACGANCGSVLVVGGKNLLVGSALPDAQLYRPASVPTRPDQARSEGGRTAARTAPANDVGAAPVAIVVVVAVGAACLAAGLVWRRRRRG